METAIDIFFWIFSGKFVAILLHPAVILTVVIVIVAHDVLTYNKPKRGKKKRLWMQRFFS